MSISFLYFLDLIGIVACSVAASLLAKRKQMDVTGAIIVAIIGSIGGGTVRDLLLNRHPIFWLTDLTYLVLIIISALLVQVFYFHMPRYQLIIRWFDAIGLAAFSVIGFEAAVSAHMSPLIVIVMGAITAIVGGMGRDIICSEIPYTLRKEIYLSASLIGGVIYIALLHTTLDNWLIQIITLGVIICIRMVAVHRDWHLPDVTLNNGTHHQD